MASQGPNNCSTGADDASVGTQAWSSPTNIQGASDSSYAQISNGVTNLTSHYLKATNFGFSVPGGATIDGIVVEWRGVAFFGAPYDAQDSGVRIVKGGTIGSTDLSSGTNWPYSYAYRTYGSSSNLWGETWTDSDVNGSNFGAAISLFGANGLIFNMEHVRITVYYTAAASGQPAARRFSQTRNHRPVEIGHEGVRVA